MHDLWGIRPTRRLLTSFLSSAAISCGAAGSALADHPGAHWSVSLVEVEIDPALDAAVDHDEVVGTVRSSLRRANQAYFYGDMPVRMKVSVRGGGAPVADILIIDGFSGSVLAEARDLALDGDALSDRALAWMDGLACASGVCESVPAATAVATKTPARPTTRETTAAGPVTPATPGSVSDEAVLAAVIPVPRPGTMARGAGADLVGSAIGRTAPSQPTASLERVRLARFDTTGLGDITYGDQDRLVLAVPVARSGERAISSSRRGNSDGGATVIGQMVDSFVSLIGLGEGLDGPPVAGTDSSRITAAAQISATPNRADVDTRLGGKRLSVRDSLASADAPFRPNARWIQVPVPGSEPSYTRGERIAALSAPGVGAVVSYSGAADGAVRYPDVPEDRAAISPVFRSTRKDIDDQPVDQFSAQRSVTGEGEPTSDLSVRLHPEIFGRFALEQFASIVPPFARNRRAEPEQDDRRVASLAPVVVTEPPSARALSRQAEVEPEARVATRTQAEIRPNVPAKALSPEAPPAPRAPQSSKPSATSLTEALAERGLALDEEVYSQNLQVSWDGSDQSDRYVMTLPRLVGFKYAVVAAGDRTLVARIESVPGPVRLSGAVAATLGLRKDEWVQVQVVALREVDRVASRGSLGQVFTSARIALPRN